MLTWNIRLQMKPMQQFHLLTAMFLDGKLIHVNFRVIMLIMDPIVKLRRKLIVLLKQNPISMKTPNRKILVQKVEKTLIELLPKLNHGITNTKLQTRFQILFFLKVMISEILMVSISLTH
jgi:hypothetical protein